jgi:hypothetical protein
MKGGQKSSLNAHNAAFLLWKQTRCPFFFLSLPSPMIQIILEFQQERDKLIESIRKEADQKIGGSFAIYLS